MFTLKHLRGMLDCSPTYLTTLNVTHA